MASGSKTAWHVDTDIEARDPNNLNDHLTVCIIHLYNRQL